MVDWSSQQIGQVGQTSHFTPTLSLKGVLKTRPTTGRGTLRLNNLKGVYRIVYTRYPAKLPMRRVTVCISFTPNLSRVSCRVSRPPRTFPNTSVEYLPSKPNRYIVVRTVSMPSTTFENIYGCRSFSSQGLRGAPHILSLAPRLGDGHRAHPACRFIRQFAGELGGRGS